MKKYINLCLVISIGILLPLILRGQAVDSPSSIIGQVFRYSSSPSGIAPGTMMLTPSNCAINAVIDGDTLRVEMDVYGIFTIPEIASKQVSLSLLRTIRNIDDQYEVTIPLGTFELMPGENVLLIPFDDMFQNLPSDNYSIMTLDGDNWVFHYPSMKGFGKYVADKLNDFPGTRYNKRKETITIPKNGIYRAYVDGSYIFALDPSASW